MDDADFGSKAVSQRVQLKHLDALYDLLEARTVLDPFENVGMQFKTALTAKEEQDLDAAVAAGLDVDMMLPYLKEWVAMQLTGDHVLIKPSNSVKFYFGYCPEVPEVYQDMESWKDVEWFEDHFPDGLEMRSVVAAYKRLENAQHSA